MARRRRYGSIEVIPGLGDIMSTFKQSVKGTDVLLGAFAALAGIWGVKKVLNMPSFVGKVPAALLNYIPAIAGAVGGAGAYFAAKKLGKGSHAAGLAMGAVAAGVGINAMNLLKVKFPELADIVDLRLSGIILNDPAVRAMRGLDGILVGDNGQLGAYGTNFAALAAAGADVDHEFMPG